MLVVILILLFTYRSPMLWLLPVISAGVALTTAQGVIYLLAKYADLTVNGQSQGILTVLVFGAGTDYALLLVAQIPRRAPPSRGPARGDGLRAAPCRPGDRRQRHDGDPGHALPDLRRAELDRRASARSRAIGIGVGLLVMITLLPALLVIFGRWIFWPARPAMGTAEPTSSGFWARVGRRIAVRPRAVWVVTVVILGVCSLGIFALNAHGLSTEDSYTKEFDSVKGQKVLTAHGLADSGSPVMVVANAGQAAAGQQALTGVEGIGAPFGPVVKDGVAFLSAPLASDPTSQAAFDTVDRVRAKVHAVDGADALVGGGSRDHGRHREGLRPRQPGDHPAGPARRAA